MAHLKTIGMLFAGVLVAGLIAVACGGGDKSSAPLLANPDRTGSELANRFISLLREKDVAGLEAFFSDAFMIQRADGSFATKTEYLTRIPAIGTFTVDGVTAKQDGDTLVVKWQLAVNEVINGQLFSPAPAPRLSTFVWSGKEWRMIGHANFNAPLDAQPLPPADVTR